jgi:hypothetical protein
VAEQRDRLAREKAAVTTRLVVVEG